MSLLYWHVLGIVALIGIGIECQPEHVIPAIICFVAAFILLVRIV